MHSSQAKKKNIVHVFLTEFIRIKGVINWSGVSFFGFILGLPSLDISQLLLPFIVFVVTTFFILSFTFAINNYYDAPSDRNNPRRRTVNAIAQGKITIKTSGIFISIFVLIPLVITFFYNLWVFTFCLVFLVWMWMYSAPPFRLKGRPGLDIIWHFIAFILLVLWGSLLAGNIAILNMLVAISFGVWSCIGQLWNHIDDYTYDKESGTNTFAVHHGLPTTKITLQIVILLNTLFLIPLIILYATQYMYTILILLSGIIIALIVKPKKDFPLTRPYYPSFVFTGFVYLSTIMYHVLIIYGLPTTGLLTI